MNTYLIKKLSHPGVDIRLLPFIIPGAPNPVGMTVKFKGFADGKEVVSGICTPDGAEDVLALNYFNLRVTETRFYSRKSGRLIDKA